MNLLAPPTDSLYKFLAISNLLVCVSLMLWSWHEADGLSQRIYDLGLEVARARVEVRFGTEEVERLRVQRKQTTDEAGALRLVARETAIAREMVLKAAERRYKLYWNERLVRQLDRNVTSAIVLVVVFFVNSALGFLLWYLKIQRYQDEIIRVQVEAARKAATGEASPKGGAAPSP